MTVVLPARNEAPNLPFVLGRMPAGINEVVLVDGRSTDGTVEVARSLREDIVVVQQNGSGKGNALACGFAASSGDIVVTIDADGSMDPVEIPDLVGAIAARQAGYAKGSRVLPGAGSEDLTRIRRLGNFALRSLVNLSYGTKYTDLCYGFNAFWRSHLAVLGFASAVGGDDANETMGFEVETCLNIRAARAGLTVVEVPSFERSRRNGTSNLRVVRDGLRVLRAILVERYRPASSARPPVVIGHLDAWRRRPEAEEIVARLAAEGAA